MIDEHDEYITHFISFYHMQVRERYEQIMRHSCALTFKEYGDHAHWQQVRLGTPRGEL